MSMAVVHEIGPLNSAVKLERLSAVSAGTGSRIHVNASKNAAAPAYDTYPSRRRALAVSRRLRLKGRQGPARNQAAQSSGEERKSGRKRARTQIEAQGQYSLESVLRPLGHCPHIPLQEYCMGPAATLCGSLVHVY
jgi:hypothetical protein